MANRTQEIVSKRTRFQKIFDTDEQTTQVAMIGASPIHYRTPQGEWDDMSNLVKSVTGGWVAETDEVRVGIESGWLTFTYLGRALLMRPTMLGMVDRTAPATRWRKLADASYANVTRDADSVTAHDIFPNTDLVVGIAEGVLTKAFTVRQRPNPPDPVSLGWNPATTYVVIIWDVQKPSGAVIKDAVTSEVVTSGYAGKNALRIETSQGDLVAMFDAGEAVSANGRKGPVWYVSLGAQVPFGEAIPYERMMATSYPFVIDPTTRVSTTTSNGGYIELYNTTYTVYASGNPMCGNNYSYWDDGKGNSGSSGGPLRGFVRWDLSALSGNCTSAKLRGGVYHVSQAAGDSKLDLMADWYPLDVNDWDTGIQSLNWASLQIPTATPAGTKAFAYNPDTGTWLKVLDTLQLQRSTDGGATWGSLIGNFAGFSKIGWANGKFFITVNGSTLYYSSNDGQTWQASAKNGFANSYPPIWNGSRYIIASSDLVEAVIYASTNGVDWGSIGVSSIPGMSGRSRVVWDGTYLWCASTGSSVLRRTTDVTGANNWEVVTGVTAPDGSSAYRYHHLITLGSHVYVWVTTMGDDDGTFYNYGIAQWNGSSWIWRQTTGFPSTYEQFATAFINDGTYIHGSIQGDWSTGIYRLNNSSLSTYNVSNGVITSLSNFGIPGVSTNGTILMPAASSSAGYEHPFFRSTNNGTTWTYESVGDTFTLPIADVQAKFGSVLPARLRSIYETYTGAAETIFYTYSWLEIETSTGTPGGVPLHDQLIRMMG